MVLAFKDNIFVVRCTFAERDYVRSLGFTWSEDGKCWSTSDPYIAYLLYAKADANAKTRLDKIRNNIYLSQSDYPVFGRGDSFYYSFQAAGVEAACAQLRAGRKAVLVADEQGIGKTPESLQIANEMGYKKLLVICPASLRLNWQAEIAKWHYMKASDVVVTGRHKVNKSKSMVVSYSLANIAKDYQPDVIICDEVHALKNIAAKRTRLILGTNFFQPNSTRMGLVEKAPVILLTGTPTPNGRPNEVWPILARFAPDTIEPYPTQWAFIKRFCIWEQDPYTDILRILGAKNLPELYVRLRGSGFMIRRLKKDVLNSLPPKRYKLVVFPENAETKQVIEREKNFSAEEILTHGVPVGSVMPTLRREMGIAKAPQ
jgi:SWI/SNF-related matrix-associated actin-dependent regulator 1 of chromatin subfamily A